MHHLAVTMKQQMIEHCMHNEIMPEGHNKRASRQADHAVRVKQSACVPHSGIGQ